MGEKDTPLSVKTEWEWNFSEHTSVMSVVVDAGTGVPNALRTLAAGLEQVASATLIGIWNCGDGQMTEPHQTVLQAVVTHDSHQGVPHD